MTILTKPSNEKNQEKILLPPGIDDVALLRAGGLPRGSFFGSRPAQSYASSPSDGDEESMVFDRPHFSCIKTLLLFLIAIIVMMMGILGGYTLYHMYAPTNTNMHYHAQCDIPLQQINNLTVPRFSLRTDDFNWRNLLPHISGDPMDELVDDNFFREEIEMDMREDDAYAKVDVPDFKDGRRGRFIHDFKENQSAIIDTTANRCFIMPLDRDTTLPPKSFMDLMQKMGSGYYNIDTERVRRKMRVVTPPITDFTLISDRIGNECYDMKVYMLENYVSGISKREAKDLPDSGKYAEFLGKGIIEFDLVNIADIDKFENTQLKK